MRILQKVNGRPNLSRDFCSRAIINIDEESLNEHRKTRERSIAHRTEIRELKSEIAEMRNKFDGFVDEIKSLINLSKTLQAK